MSKWLHWEPGDTQIMADSPGTAPPKPTKPYFGSFGSPLSGENPIIRAPGPPQEASGECGPECYEVEPGKRIHQPWTGQCKAEVQLLVAWQIELKCWHCGGSGSCPCVSCTGECPSGTGGECVICKGSGKALAWVQ